MLIDPLSDLEDQFAIRIMDTACLKMHKKNTLVQIDLGSKIVDTIAKELVALSLEKHKRQPWYQKTNGE